MIELLKLLSRSAFQLSAGLTAPMPPVFGPSSPSRERLVARGREHAKGFSADERVHGAFASVQTFFHDDPPAGFTESALFHHRANRLARIRTIVRHDDAFAKG